MVLDEMLDRAHPPNPDQEKIKASDDPKDFE